MNLYFKEQAKNYLAKQQKVDTTVGDVSGYTLHIFLLVTLSGACKCHIEVYSEGLQLFITSVLRISATRLASISLLLLKEIPKIFSCIIISR